MSRKQIVAIVVIVLSAAFILWLARASRQPPLLPPDDVHAAFEGAQGCLQCHDAGAPYPRSKGHPLGDDCLRCHGRR